MSIEAATWEVFAPLLTGRPEVFVTRLRRTPVSPAQQIGFLARHGLTTTIREPLAEHGLWSELPDVANAVRAARRIERVLAVKSLDTMTELHQALSAAGVRHMFLKGPLLAQRVYGGLEDRSVGDIDLLVRPESVDWVEQHLLGTGFERRYGLLWGRSLSRFFTHHLAFRRGRDLLELHWSPAREPGLRVDLERLWTDEASLEVRDRSYPVPSLETCLLIQVLTIVKDLSLGVLRLRSLVDIERIVEHTEEKDVRGWSELLDRFEALGARRLAVAALDLSLHMLECRDGFGHLAESLASCRSTSLDDTHPTLGLRIFDLSPPAWHNKRRLFPLYRGGAVRAWAWWALSAPWRRRVYAG